MTQDQEAVIAKMESDFKELETLRRKIIQYDMIVNRIQYTREMIVGGKDPYEAIEWQLNDIASIKDAIRTRIKEIER